MHIAQKWGGLKKREGIVCRQAHDLTELYAALA